MYNTTDIVKNIQTVYDSNTAFHVLKDFERVIDELNLYVYENWQDGELCEGPKIERHWVTCSFMWPRKQMPNPEGGKRLLDYDCVVEYRKTHVLSPRKIRKPGDIRPGTKKGKLDRKPVWIVTIKMPKKLLADIYGGYNEIESLSVETPQEAPQPADMEATQAPEVPTGEGAEDLI